MRIPKGLERCDVCGECKGAVKEKDLPKGHRWFKTGDPERLTQVLCICEGTRCKVCGRRAIHRPCSVLYDEGNGKFWYVPGFIVWALVCDRCRSRR